MNVRAAIAFGLFALASHALAADDQIHILSAKFGDPSAEKLCEADLGFCEGSARCEVDVTETMCKVPEGAKAMILLVTFQCGKGAKKNVAAYKGQKLTLVRCP